MNDKLDTHDKENKEKLPADVEELLLFCERPIFFIKYIKQIIHIMLLLLVIRLVHEWKKLHTA